MFSPRRIVFWLSVVLQSVNALNAAGPYELVYLYNAYKMEYATVPAASRKIAPGCVHKPFLGDATLPLGVIEAANTAAAVAQGVEGICTFYEFWHLVGTNAWTKALAGKEFARASDPFSISNPLTRTLNPDADRFADAVNDPATTQNRRLATLPNLLWSPAELALMGGGNNAAWATQLQRGSTVIEAAREVMANRLLADPDNAVLQTVATEFQTAVDTAVDNLSAVHQFRSGDFSGFLVNAQQEHVSWTSSPMSTSGVIDTPQYEHINGNPSALIRGTGATKVIETTYQVVNWQDSFNAARTAGTPLTTAQKQALKAFSATYGTVVGSIEKAHKDILDVVKFARDLHRKPLIFEAIGEFLSCPV